VFAAAEDPMGPRTHSRYHIK